MAVALLRYGFERAGLIRILGIADAENVASRRVLKKSGMTFERCDLREGRKQVRYSVRSEDLPPRQQKAESGGRRP